MSRPRSVSKRLQAIGPYLFAELDRLLRDQATDPPVDGLLLRAELLCRNRQFRDCAAFWNEAARREPALQRVAFRRAIRASIEAGRPFAVALDLAGDDLYVGDRKLSISIAAPSPTSALIHFALNIDPTGAPVRARPRRN